MSSSGTLVLIQVLATQSAPVAGRLIDERQDWPRRGPNAVRISTVRIQSYLSSHLTCILDSSHR